jgi:predicted alpha/beta hydrolase family esterase
MQQHAMTTPVLIVQGGGARVHDEWDNKLVESLERELGSDYTVVYPRMPYEASPTYAAWAAAITRELARLDDGAILVGHSVGGTILIRLLADNPPELTLSGIFLIAPPFVGKGGWPSEDIEPLSDLGARLPAKTPIFVYQGSNDATTPLGHARLYAEAIPHAVVRRLPGRDHQLNNDMSEVAADIRHVGAGRLSADRRIPQ